MARTAITPTQVTMAGVALPAATAGTVDGHFVNNNGRTWLVFSNGNAAARTVTIPTPPTFQGQAVADITISVPGSATHFACGPFPGELVNRQSGTSEAGALYINYPAGQETDVSTRAMTL
jgi:hypothetical protein